MTNANQDLKHGNTLSCPVWSHGQLHVGGKVAGMHEGLDLPACI